jgi:ATP-dependent exoDNAse (exonuclease V) beta subunit
MEEELFPFRGLDPKRGEDIEEERRLAYVAVTRARERLYLSAAAQKRGRIIAGPGSLAHVCPSGLIQAMQAALDGAADVAWIGSDHVHTMRVCPAVPVVEPTSTEPGVVPVSDVVPMSLQPLVTHPQVQRGRVTDVAAGRLVGRHVRPLRPPIDVELVTGRAVHRLLARAGASDDDALLRARVLADLEPDELLAVDEAPAFCAGVVALVRGVWSDEVLRRILASPAARFEVPIAFRHDEAGVVHVVRGSIDCLVPDGNRLLVLEFKTGHPQPSHRRQLALYVDAVRAMAPDALVDGQLVYATPAASRRPMTAPRLPFDP